MNLFKINYRIVTDSYLGYEVQSKRWWFPFWIQTSLVNTHHTVNRARSYIERRANFIVEEYNPHFNTKEK